MRNRLLKPALILAIAFLAISLTACPATTTPPAPAPIVLAQTLKTIADAGNAAVDALRVAKTNGTISAADFATAENILATVAHAGLQIDAEQQTSDDWATQKNKILTILQTTGLDQLKAKVSGNTYAIVVAVITAVNQLSVSLGGPTI